jgi:3-hydroxyisobutyrate dehydrogenase
MQTKTMNPQSTRVGWIGLGVMGRSMCEHIVKAGYKTTVYSRTMEKASPLVSLGATCGANPSEVAVNSDVVFTMVGMPSDVRQVILEEHGVLAGASPGTVIVDMSTSEPSLAVEIARKAQGKGVIAMDAPVSGGDIGAKNAALSIMVGGDVATFAALEPLFQLMGKMIVYQGGPGRGQHTKMVNQILIANNMMGTCEALLYAHRVGLDLETVLKSVSGGAASSWSLVNLSPRIIAGDFEPGFFIEHFLKDMKIILDETASMNLALPGLALAKQLYQAVAAHGHSKRGTQALLLGLAELNNIPWKLVEPSKT